MSAVSFSFLRTYIILKVFNVNKQQQIIIQNSKIKLTFKN